MGRQGNDGRKAPGAELLAPAGDFETALAAFAAGADAVYCGMADFSARAFAKNFTAEELRRLMRVARRDGKKVYVTFNTLLDEADLGAAVETLATLAEIGPDALIIQDLGVARICRRHFPELKLHASTQLVTHNLAGVLALDRLGFTRVVLARELSLGEIAAIARGCGGVELEVFIHGALCYSLSGLCLFGAMEKDRSGNRGMCPYCCRLPYESADGAKTLAFSMKDLRVGEEARKLAAAGVKSLKIEGRMKSPLYVASVAKYYRRILDGARGPGGITESDLETVFSRRTTRLYLNGHSAEKSPIDTTSLGHLGTPVGTVRKIVRDRDGSRWVRFHTARRLERHDGLQFAGGDGGKPDGFGIGEMRPAGKRSPVFETEAGTEVEVRLPDLRGGGDWTQGLKAGVAVYCSMSNAVKRAFPAPNYRESDYEGSVGLEVELEIAGDRVRASAAADGETAEVALAGVFESAKNPEKTREVAEKAFAKLGGTDYRLARLKLADPGRRFVPASMLNDLRREVVAKLEKAREQRRLGRIAAAKAELGVRGEPSGAETPGRTVKIRVGQPIPEGKWDEVVVAINGGTTEERLPAPDRSFRLALPVYTSEPDFARLRERVRGFLEAGYAKWEASDLATLSMLRELGVEDVTADWTLYAFNSQALAALSELGVRRFTASPENGRDNLGFLARSGCAIEMLAEQCTPLFISLTEPAGKVGELAVYRRDGLWVTTRAEPRRFELPDGVTERVDRSWNP